MLSVEGIAELARAQTGLTDFGDTSFMEGMEAIFASLNGEAMMNERGFRGMTASHTRNLVNRLRAEEAFKQDPSILEQELLPPIFILGMPRTGTTALHRMLTNDGRFTYLPTWVAMNPALFPNAKPGEQDPRIPIAEAEEEMNRTLVPEVYAAHPFRAHEAEEEIFILRYSYLTLALQTYCYTPSYGEWLKGRDQRPTYEYLKKILLLVQSQNLFPGSSKFLLKSPFHLNQLDNLFAVFPNAKVIACHRDPADVFASWTSLITNLHYLNSDVVDHAKLASYWTEKLIDMLDGFVEQRRTIPSSQVLDFPYLDIVATPENALERIYDFIDMPLTDEARTRVLGWKEQNPQHKFGKHTYKAEALPLDMHRIRAGTKAYTDAYVR